jgi:hypothetical protein
MAAQHTPGPWTHTGREFNDVYDSEGQLIAVALHLRVGKPERSVAQATSNARLIAAAPDLLAELQNIANANPREWDEEVRDQFQQWAQNRARAAIAKATGGAA